jgi:membrane protease YdiL (CAAX protease family)
VFALATDAQTQPEIQPVPVAQTRLLAPWWHTALLIAVLLFASLNGTRGRHPLAGHSRLPQYLWGMTWEWLLLGFTWIGIRKRITLRELIGGRWASMEDFFLDVVYAGTFWICAMVVLGAGAKLLHLDEAGKIASMRKQLGFLTPGSKLELTVWFCLSATAGFCEEIIFRGYLQRQFAAITHSMLAGLLLSAIVFGASHGYEGIPRMALIGLFGLMFGLLAWWRKSLRPGIMAHTWHDAFSGAVLRMLR